jgi:energy-coupling factor transporter transmembrane protein EcfT
MSPRRGGAWVLLGALAAALVAARHETALLALAVAGTAAAVAGAPRPGPRAVAGVAAAGATAIAINLVLMPGRAIGPVLPFGLAPTAEGLARGSLLALRLAGAAAALHGLRAAWPGESAADEIARLLRPLERLRLPVREARAMVGLALRFSPLLAAEVRRIARLQDLRAGGAARGARERLARARAALLPALVGALERAERVALALEARHDRLRPVAGGAPAPAAAAVAWIVAGASLLWRG